VLICLAHHLIWRHEATPLLVLTAAPACAKWICLTDHACFDTSIAPPLYSTSCKATEG
jgi:hypothetical protein